MKPKIKEEYPSNFNITSSGQKENKNINPKTDSNKKENINKRISINIKPLLTNTDNYIKVNTKANKYKNINTETYHRLNLNTFSLYNNKTNIKAEKNSKKLKN